MALECTVPTPARSLATTTDNQPEGAVFDKRTGILVVDGQPIALEQGEKFLLQALVEKGAAGTRDLARFSPRPDRTLQALLKKHPALMPYITLPGGPCRGGYSTTIKPKSSLPEVAGTKP